MFTSDPYSLITGILGGGVLGTWLGHRLVINREARARKVDFRGFLGRWLVDIQRVHGGDSDETYRAYLANVQHVGGYAAKLNRDFPFRRRRFKAMCNELATLLPEHLKGAAGDCRDVVARKIEALIDFV
jgi:hypothetical protein